MYPSPSLGAFLVKDDRVLKGPLGRSLRSFTRTAHSAHSLCSATLASSVHGLAHSLCSLPCRTVEILEYVFTLLSRFMGTNAFLVLTRNTTLVRHVAIAPCHWPSHLPERFVVPSLNILFYTISFSKMSLFIIFFHLSV